MAFPQLSSTLSPRFYHHQQLLSFRSRSPLCIRATASKSDTEEEDLSKASSLNDFVDPEWLRDRRERFMGLSDIMGMSDDYNPSIELESPDDDVDDDGDDGGWVSAVSQEESIQLKKKALDYMEKLGGDTDLTELKEELQQAQQAIQDDVDEDDDDGPSWVLKDKRKEDKEDVSVTSGETEVKLQTEAALNVDNDDRKDSSTTVDLNNPTPGLDEMTGEYMLGAYVDLSNPPENQPELELEPPDLEVDWSDMSGWSSISTAEERLDVEEKLATYIPTEERGRGRRGKRKTKQKKRQLLEQLQAKREGREIPVFEEEKKEEKKAKPPPENIDPKMKLAERHQQKEKKKAEERPNMEGTSWMQKNRQFSRKDEKETKPEPQEEKPSSSFREDFRGTRVFVQNIPLYMEWPELKDHFSILGEVVYASISTDRQTGESKGVGVVQYETTDMAQRAIREMRNHPLEDGTALFVREDVQEGKLNAKLHFKAHGVEGSGTGPTVPQTWKPADEDTVDSLSRQDYEEIRKIMKRRDNARKTRDFDTSDRLRDELKQSFRVYLDDRVKLWWVARENYQDGELMYNDLYGAVGRRGGGRKPDLEPWRQIETTPEKDALVDPQEVDRLLTSRDRARRAKNFDKADRLLEEATHVPNDPNVVLRIHDPSRTWRIWVDERQHRKAWTSTMPKKSPEEQCMEIVKEHAPHKAAELAKILEAFPGREYKILKSIKRQYLNKGANRENDSGAGRLAP